MNSFDCSEYLKLYKLKKIGSGGFGVVYKANHKITGEEVAVKIISKFSIQGANSTHKIYTEAKVLQSLHHSKIISLFNVFMHGSKLVLIMEYLKGGSLKDHIKVNGPLSEEAAR